MVIYHGDNKAIETPEIIIGKFTKDFGPGFYCTTIREQAVRWAQRNLTSIVSYYKYIPDSKLDILEFKNATDDWLDFVIACRSGVAHSHDIVIGPMADDQIYNYINDFLEGNITREQFWVLAKFKYPTHQICLCTNEALKCIKYQKSVTI